MRNGVIPRGRKNPLPFPFSTLTQSTICTQATPQGKRVFKEGRNRMVYPFCSRAGRRTFPARRSARNLSPRNGEPLYPMKSSTRSAALCIACSALCAACLAFRRIDGLSIAPAATIETTAPAIAPVAMPETKGEIRIKDLPPFIKFIESVCPLVPQILHSKKMLVWHNRLFTIACSYYIIYLTIRL